jgi:hypothetical protein
MLGGIYGLSRVGAGSAGTRSCAVAHGPCAKPGAPNRRARSRRGAGRRGTQPANAALAAWPPGVETLGLRHGARLPNSTPVNGRDRAGLLM